MITPTEASILRDIRDGERGRTPRTAETDAAIVSLLQRGLVAYRKERPAQRFNVTQAGIHALTDFDREALSATMASLPRAQASVAASLIADMNDGEIADLVEKMRGEG